MQAREQRRIGRHRRAAVVPELIQRQDARHFAGQKNPRGWAFRSSGLPERSQRLRIFDEDRLRIRIGYSTDQLRGGQTGVEGGGNTSVRDCALIGEIELGAGLGIERHDVALGDADGVETAGYFTDDVAVLGPGICFILWRILRSGRLVQCDGVRLLPGGFFENFR